MTIGVRFSTCGSGLSSSVMCDEGFEECGDLLLLRARETRGGFDQNLVHRHGLSRIKLGVRPDAICAISDLIVHVRHCFRVLFDDYQLRDHKFLNSP